MKLQYVILIISATILLSACAKEIHSFDECVNETGIVMESFPRQCSVNGQTFVETVDTNEIKPCTKEYRPVCGEVQVQCIKAPCDPIKTTFANKCLANNENAINIQDGACTDEKTNYEGACLSFDGNWVLGFNECEGMSETQCLELGGTYNECASACRNNPEAEICTMQCVQVCSFN